ncbi:MAG: GNAT family N-acetyltransferase [Dichotomicrobium sp.]
MSEIIIDREATLDPDEFLSVLERSGLGERRPVDDAERVAQMCANANLIVTARDNGALVGVARSLTDFAYVCYCSDLAVDRAHQGRGIGRRLLAHTRELIHPAARLVLLAAPASISYYEHIGMSRVSVCFADPPPRS